MRRTLLPYGRQSIDDEDVEEVVRVLRSDWLTTGPDVAAFERDFAEALGARMAVAVNSGTAALHVACFAAGIGPGDEVIVPAMTFAATANVVVHQGARPVFADVEPDTLLIDPVEVRRKITPRTKAVIAVDYAGQPCDYDALREVIGARGIVTIADACHALGAADRARPVGSLAQLNAFSLHAVKHITSGEGGVVTTDDPQLAARMRIFRNHGITSDHRERAIQGSYFYEMVELGYNYRLTDFQCALARSQLRKLSRFLELRRRGARRYDDALQQTPGARPLSVRAAVQHAYHLYPILLEPAELRATRDEIYAALRAEGIGVNVHYIPVHLHPYYRERLGTARGQCPVAEQAFDRLLTLPLFPAMTAADVDDVIEGLRKVLGYYHT